MDFVSTRGGGDPVGFFDAFANGLAPDGGLYVPKHLPLLPSDLLIDDAMPYAALAWDILGMFDSDHDTDHLIDLIDRSYGDFSDTMSAPLQQLSDNLFVLELFHGPTLSFKDFGLQLVGNLFEEQIERTGQAINVLGATSGDTGSAAIHGLAGKKDVNVFILYPKDGISKLQERQMTCTGEKNIFPIAIDGNFDDAQAIVKELMGDAKVKEKHNLSAINSINIARILAQAVYYVHAYMQLPPDNRDDVRFVVPTGNFGNVFAGWMVNQMGLPVDQFVVATNQNDILYRFFESGNYEPEAVQPSYAPSMDIQMASNFERFLYYHNDKNAKTTAALMAELKKNGSLHEQNFDPSNFTASRSTDEDILETIKEVYDKYNYVVDPHTACAFQDLDVGNTHIVLATAHPAKFPDVIKKAIGETPTEDSLEALKKKKQVKHTVEATPEAVKKFLDDNAA